MTGYKPCIQGQCGDSTVTAQQKRLLTIQGIKNSPRKQWDDDFCRTINEWKKDGNEILWMGDLNGGMDDNDVADIMDQTELYEIFGAKHGDVKINTHIHGSKQIDFFLGTQALTESVEKAGILPFYDSIDSDHRGMYIDINKHQLFRGEIHNIEARSPRKLKTKFRNTAKLYRQQVSQLLTGYQVKQRARKLQKIRKEEWNEGKQKTAAELDDHLGISMMEPENEIPKRDLPWWSKELHKAHLLVKYWKAKHFYTI